MFPENSVKHQVLSMTKSALASLMIILVMPATNAVSKRFFSTLRRVKSYLRSTMSQARLNHAMLLHIHKNHTDHLDLIDISSEFVKESPHRQSVFGIFLQTDL